MNFRVGQRVCCIDYDGGANGLPLIEKGQIHTISEIRTSSLGGGCLMFVGYRPGAIQRSNGIYEVYYTPSKYRPLVEKKTDISLFTKMLTQVDA